MNPACFGHPKAWKKKMKCTIRRQVGRLGLQKLVSNARANLFPKIRERITKYVAFYRCTIAESFDLNAGR